MDRARSSSFRLAEPRRRHQCGIFTALLICLSAPLGAAAQSGPDPVLTLLESPELQTQRAAFRRALPKAMRGERSALEEVSADYLLYPYLEAAWLGADLDSRGPRDIADFLGRHGEALPARRLRYRWLLHLAKQERWSEYLATWRGVTRPDVTLRCHQLSARLDSANPNLAQIEDDARTLWLVGHSQPDACNPAFAWLARNGMLGLNHYHDRVQLALKSRQLGLARYLSRKAGPRAQARAARWTQATEQPRQALARADAITLAADDPQWLYLAFDRLAVRYPGEAAEHLARLRAEGALTRDLDHRIERRIALSFARDLAPQAAGALDSLAYYDLETAAWRGRTAMRANDWPALIDAIKLLPDAERTSVKWQYWQGRALHGLGRTEDAVTVWTAVARDRSYHGFLAADRAGKPYAFAHAEAVPTPTLRAALLDRDALREALELWATGQLKDAQAQWTDLIGTLSRDQKREAALIADTWGWHPSAISAAASARLWDDLHLRFPLPWVRSFDQWAGQSGLPTHFTLGIARSESLFSPEVVSKAGALGLMQLMPATGKAVAQRTASAGYQNRQSLFDPQTNIALGTTYLADVLGRLDQHPALASAAYNAGEHRVYAWLPRERPLDADAWVDSVPFTETRHYVRRVMMASIIYDWRLSDPAGVSDSPRQPLSTLLPPVPTRDQLKRP
ncbi:MAG: transglycosylase SLT domain-containing protein [Pseudomonadota bacterium]